MLEMIRNQVVQIRINPKRIWRWHLWLIEELARSPVADLSIFVVSEAGALPSPVLTLLSLERLIYGLAGEHACDLLSMAEIPHSLWKEQQDQSTHEARGGIVLDLSGGGKPMSRSGPWLTPSFDGQGDDLALIGALLVGHLPELVVTDIAQPDLAWVAAPAVEDKRVLTRALDNVFSSLHRLWQKALSGAGAAMSGGLQGPIRRGGNIRSSPMLWPIVRFAAWSVSLAASRRLTALCRDAPHWFVAWRWVTDERVHLTRRFLPSDYLQLRDDGGRYYADPFAIVADGCHYLFCEEFDYRLGRGVISVTEVRPNETPQRPRVVLERPYHLSYPFVFEYRSQIWMIPETSSAGTVELYRANRFPDKWVLEDRLLEGISAGDATLIRKDGQWWMFAATSERQSSSWDALSLFHAPDLLGPWTPHRLNPILIDRRSARPGGALFEYGGLRWRPAQDCTEAYGAGLALCSVDRLDEEDYVQSVRGVISPQPNGARLHTLNWVRGLELVDGLGWGAMRRRSGATH
jgi:hypothetical protein